MVYSIWSYALLLDPPDTVCCYVSEREWNRINDEMGEVKRIFAKIKFNNKTVVCALGPPIREALIDLNVKDVCPVFIALWAFDFLTLEGVGSRAEIEWCSEEMFPEATRIVLRPHKSVFYQSNAKYELEDALTQYGILQVGTTIPIKIKALDNYIIDFDVIELEPSSIALMQGDEVAIEFEKTFDQMMNPDVPPENTLVAPPQIRFDDDNDEPMISVANANSTMRVIDGGHVLGGVRKPRLTDGRLWTHWRNK